MARECVLAEGLDWAVADIIFILNLMILAIHTVYQKIEKSALFFAQKTPMSFRDMNVHAPKN
jgi:hypothetical protein